MDDQTKTSYAYDPFKQEGRDRWGRKGKEKQTPPEIPNYDIIDFLGEGGMATVWSAKYRPLNQPRAVKVLSQAVAVDANFVERFAEEAKSLARLEHPNIVKVYDASTDPKAPYLAMDFVAGKTLSDILKTRNLTLDEAIKYFGHIADALDYAHGNGFVHRDIKPSNVMIANTGKAMLIDFGVASWLGGVGERPNTILGTTRYMSPEACRGERVTMASDLWAFGVLMYRTLTGSMPFDGKSEQEITHAILNLPPKEPKHPNAKVRAFLKRILAKNPHERPKSAGAMANEFARAVRPFALKRYKDGIAVGTSLLLVGLVVVGLVGGVVAYKVTRKPSNVASTTKKSKLASSISAGAVATNTTENAGSPVTVEGLSGIWYATFGNTWEEIRLDPTTGKKFHLSISKRDQSNVQNSEAEGELAGDKLTFHDGNTTFTGEVNADHSRISGKLTGAGTESGDGEWVRASGLAMTSQQNSQLGYSVSVPSGWQTNTGDSIAASPIGRQDVYFAVTSTPLDGAQSVLDVFKRREGELAAVNDNGGSYTSVATDASVSFGGLPGASWDLVYQQQGGAKMKAKIFGVIRGDNKVLIESWWPANEDDIWSPVLESIRQSFRFTN